MKIKDNIITFYETIKVRSKRKLKFFPLKCPIQKALYQVVKANYLLETKIKLVNNYILDNNTSLAIR